MFKISFSFLLSLFLFSPWLEMPSHTLANEIRISDKAKNLLAKGPIKGLTLGMHSYDYDYDYKEQLAGIQGMNTSWIQLNVKFYQEYNHSDEIKIPEVDSYFWDQLGKTIDQAKALGFKVSFLPIVLIEDAKKGEWRGTLDPEDKQKWYNSYKTLILTLAHLAEAKGIELFSVGSEYCSLQKDTAEWLQLISDVKAVYQGSLFYSANWDAIESVDFQKELDFLGVTGYNSLTRSKDPRFDELLEAWAKIKSNLLDLQRRKGLPFIFSEVGYTSQNGTNMDPWNYLISQERDESEQVMCYQSFINTWEDEEAFYGAFVYDWFTHGGPEDLGYSVKNKMAEPLLRSWFCH